MPRVYHVCPPVRHLLSARLEVTAGHVTTGSSINDNTNYLYTHNTADHVGDPHVAPLARVWNNFISARNHVWNEVK